MKILIVAMLLLLGACSAPSVPDETYFRLPASTNIAALNAQPLFAQPLVVDVFSADGLYAEQALIYTTDTEAGTLRAYHYQLWADPPSRMLQRRLVDQLRDAKVAPLVTDRLPSGAKAWRISGLIRRFERVKQAQGFRVVVNLQMRLDAAGQPLLEQNYVEEIAVSATTLDASVQAFGAAVDAIFKRFQADLATIKVNTHAD